VKKTVLIVALAAILAFAFAVPAFAVNRSGQMRFGAANPAQGAGAGTYLDWDENLGTNAGDNTPHGNYTTTTVKCAVCHAVHYAAPGGAPVGSGQAADTLLRVKAADSCAFCHATAGVAVNGRPVYDGMDGALTASNTGGAFDTGHYTGTNCDCCHATVHGVGADDSVAALKGYMLLEQSATNVQGTGAPTANMLEAIIAIDHNAENQGFAPGAALNGTIADYANTNTDMLRQQAVGIFCAECHNGAYATAAAGAATNVRASGDAAFSGHRIAAAATSDWNAGGTISSGSLQNATVAWAAATDCRSCHDALDSFGNPAFPHSWGGTKMWLTAAADASKSPTEALPYGTAPGSAYNDGRPQLSDGVCLKCHVAPGGVEGVGVTF